MSFYSFKIKEDQNIFIKHNFKKRILIRNKRVCTQCGTNQTPDWRKDIHNNILCNTCGLRYKRKFPNIYKMKLTYILN